MWVPCTVSFVRSLWNFVWIPRVVCFSLWHNQMPSLPRFVYFFFVSFAFLPRLHSATMFRCHAMMDIGDILHGISFTHMCYCSVFLGISSTAREFTSCMSTSACTHKKTHSHKRQTTYIHDVHRSLNYEFLFRSSIYVTFVSEIEIDDWMAVNLEKCRYRWERELQINLVCLCAQIFMFILDRRNWIILILSGMLCLHFNLETSILLSTQNTEYFFSSNDSSVSTLYTYTYSSSPFSLSICVRRTRRDFSLYIRFSVEA